MLGVPNSIDKFNTQANEMKSFILQMRREEMIKRPDTEHYIINLPWGETEPIIPLSAVKVTLKQLASQKRITEWRVMSAC